MITSHGEAVHCRQDCALHLKVTRYHNSQLAFSLRS